MAISTNSNDSNATASEPFLSKNGINRTVSSANSIQEARQHLLKAERSVKPNLMRWKAKHATAGDEYCKAAILFYQAGEVEASKSNLLKACESFKKKKQWYSAAKTLEQAMAITHKQNDLATMTELAWRSAALFRKAGQPDSAAQLLERASKALEEKQPGNAILMLEKATETVETENRPIQAASYVSRLLRMSLERNDDKEESISRARKLVELFQEAGHTPSTGRAVLGLVVLLLDVHRVNEAEIVAREFGNNCTQEQNVLIEDLLDAFDQNDVESLQRALKHKCLTSLGPEFGKVLESVCLTEEAQKIGAKPRGRSRRIFSVIKMEEKKEEPPESNSSNGDKTSDGASSGSSEDEAKKEEDEGANKRNAKKRVTGVSFSADVGNDDKAKEEQEKKKTSTEQKEIPKSKIPGAKKRPPLVKGKTTDIPASAANFVTKIRKSKSQDQKNGDTFTPYIDVTSDSISRHRPSNLPDPATYVDVTGVDPIQPAYMGMTVEQWRTFKRSHAQDDQEYAFDDSVGAVGDDGGDW